MIELPEEVKLFLLEAYENLELMEQLLVEIEKRPREHELLHTIFRSIHTIKGNSAFLGYSQIELLCHNGEGVLDALRNGRLQISPPLTSVLLELVDQTRTLLLSVEETGTEGSGDTESTIAQLRSYLRENRDTASNRKDF